MRERMREIIPQTCERMGVDIVRGVLARDHIHMFLSIPPKLSLSDGMQRIKGCSSRRIQVEFPELHKRCWGRQPACVDASQSYLYAGSSRLGAGVDVLVSDDAVLAWIASGLHLNQNYKYLHADISISDARAAIGRYPGFNNSRRPHSSLDGKNPDQAYVNLSVAA